MRNRIHATTLLLGFALALMAQSGQENLLLLTDRAHYMSGETIRFRAFYQKPPESGEAEWSRVLYVELIMPDGTALVSSKFALEPSGADGQILIPGGLSSGTYYLKAYTRWMRNCGPEGPVYTSVRIYDSFNEAALPVDSGGWEAVSVEQLLSATKQYPAEQLECHLKKYSFHRREKVEVELGWNSDDFPLDMTVSVAREGLQGNQEYFGRACQVPLSDDPSFLPETRGLYLAGQAVDASGAQAVPYATIYVTMLGAERDFFCNYSDSAGRFYFTFPGYYDSRELFVSTFHPEHPELELLIERDFSLDAPHLPSYPLPLNDSLASLITEMSVNAQVAQQYYPVSSAVPEQDTAGELLFYGQAMATIEFSDFIKLPRLEEYFIEVIPQVAVRRSHGVKRLLILGEHPDLEIYPPLLMIDGVAIFDLEAVLAVSPRLIERVEIVNAPYIRGNVTFGGIISLISKNNDLGYIDLPSSGLLVNYQMLDRPPVNPSPIVVKDPRMPDVRNTLYWNPVMKLAPQGAGSFSFYTSDLAGSYEILLRGSDSLGNYLEKKVLFTVQ